jgi:hypothetical protein
MQKVAARFAGMSGFSPQLRAMSDDGARKRLVRINRYGEDIDLAGLRALMEGGDAKRDWLAVLEVLEDYEFLTVHEQA